MVKQIMRKKNRVVVELTTSRAITQKQACHIVHDILDFGKHTSPLMREGWPKYQDVKLHAFKVKEGERVIVGAATRMVKTTIKPQGALTGRFTTGNSGPNVQNLPRDANSIMQQMLRLYTREELAAALRWAIAADKVAR